MKVSIKLSIILLSAVLVFACQNDPPSQGAARLNSITIGGKAPAGRSMPPLISEDDWDGVTIGFDLYTYDIANPGTIYFSLEEEITNARINARVSSGARAFWGVGSRGAKPEEFFSTGVPVTFDTDDYIYIMVVSANGINTVYYRFYCKVLSPVCELASFSIDTVEVFVADTRAKPGSQWDQAELDSVQITRTQATGAVIEAVPWDPTATVEYARTTQGVTPVFSDNNKLVFNDMDLLCLKVIAQNGEDVYYYRFRIYTGRDSTIKKLKLGEYAVTGLGSPAGWPGVTPGSFDTADQPDGGFTVEIELNDPDGSYTFVKIANAAAGEPSWPASPSTAPVVFGNGETLAIRIVPVNPLGATQYYKIPVKLLAAKFRTQPKSAVYYAEPTFYSPGGDYIKEFDNGVLPIEKVEYSGTVAALSFELDRPLPGATYQWFEANSWYGGYGFDADGHITLRKKRSSDDPDLPPDGTRYEGDWVVEEDFQTREDPHYFGTSGHPGLYAANLDEKTNVSFFNGGNYYRYPVKGRAITGETSQSYTPPINKKPFISGWTSEIHYYWVVVKADGLEAISARAAIITEIAKEADTREYKMITEEGEETITIKPKKHYIVDLNTVYDKEEDKNEEGIHLPAKNVVPFPKKREGNYYIPITFPSGFNVKDYSNAIIQAKFYLADGTPWVQNWTQGDIGFADADEENIVLYYNLTNNNAGLGLESDGKEPSGGGLTATPAFIVVKAAGEKPERTMPPLIDPPAARTWETADGVGKTEYKIAQNIGDAQGWFCPFIELVEVRFEGPAR